MLRFHANKPAGNTSQQLALSQSLDLPQGVNFRVWDVLANDVQYQYEQGHTLSLYLSGGHRTYRKDMPDKKGRPGALCLMPQGHWSQWQTLEPIRIAHLYVPDTLLRREAERHFDMDARFANLRDLVYQQDQALSHQILSFINTLNSGAVTEHIYMEQMLSSLSCELLAKYCDTGALKNAVAGGLSPQDRRTIKTYILNNLGDKLSIEMLAAKLALSPYHFARMFKLSFGDSPADYILRHRVEWAKGLLKGQSPLTDIALRCGFSHQSHFSNYFKKFCGVTPAKYRKMLHST